MTIHCGGFAALSTAWILLVIGSSAGVVLIKNLRRP